MQVSGIAGIILSTPNLPIPLLSRKHVILLLLNTHLMLWIPYSQKLVWRENWNMILIWSIYVASCF
jgi:hypothetical protein